MMCVCVHGYVYTRVCVCVRARVQGVGMGYEVGRDRAKSEVGKGGGEMADNARSIYQNKPATRHTRNARVRAHVHKYIYII